MAAMFDQLFLGTILTVLTFTAAALLIWVFEAILRQRRPWLLRPPHGLKLMLLLCLTLFWMMAMLTVAVWIWAVAFRLLGIFGTLEASVYFSLVAFTTLGFGDVLLPQEWRLLSGLSAANGLLMFGLMTAVLVETLRETRGMQREGPS
ncbi:ion channel [Ovoidimarina sediminis]|uniref:ion channel n=1 Tax=Ovoidimarina sediminis TaxID=3079856 RepID=UPI00290DAC4C|nr:ion channel [Rhodophyticola sp. MJ-SS7]MDU8943974.1 ion channel [Rhodophyticola sp. MJ-SS7]